MAKTDQNIHGFSRTFTKYRNVRVREQYVAVSNCTAPFKLKRGPQYQVLCIVIEMYLLLFTHVLNYQNGDVILSVFWQEISVLSPKDDSLKKTSTHTKIFSLILRWRHNGRDGVSNHQRHGCLLKRLSRRNSKKTSKLRVTGLCAGNSPVTGEFPIQKASNAENVSIWWRHHGYTNFKWTV